jgi:hypothetical protein
VPPTYDEQEFLPLVSAEQKRGRPVDDRLLPEAGDGCRDAVARGIVDLNWRCGF